MFIKGKCYNLDFLYCIIYIEEYIIKNYQIGKEVGECDLLKFREKKLINRSEF